MRTSILFFLVVVSIYGCHRETTADKIHLQMAEAMTRTHPDSALALLHDIKQPKRLSSADYAQYALCYNDAAWHIDPHLLSDSLVTLAVEYYIKAKNDKKSAMAFFLLSKIKEEEHDAQARATALMQAETYAQSSGNMRVLGLVYEEKGLILFDQDADSSSVEQYKKAETIFSFIHDTHNEIVENMNIANVFLMQTCYDSSWYYYNVAEGMARLVKDTVLLSSILRLKGLNALYQGHTEDALHFLQQSLRTSHDAYDAGKYMNLGWVYLKQKRYKIARKTLLMGLQHHPPLGLEEACYHQLINVAYAQHDLKGIRKYALQYVGQADSAYDSSLKASLLGLEKKYHYERLHTENQALTIKNQRLFLGILGALLLLMINGYFSLRITLKNKEIQLLREQEKVRLAEREQAVRESMVSKLDVYEKLVSLRTMPNDSPEHVGVQFQNLFNDGVLKSQSSIQEFIQNVDEVYDQFSVKLKAAYPQLTKQDILVCCLIRAGFDTSTIVGFLAIQMESFHMRCHRIRERMSIPRKANLAQFLAKFSSDSES